MRVWKTTGGGAMKWFAKQKPGDIWDEAIEWPLGDIEAAERIRTICEAAAASAAGSARNDKSDTARYERAVKVAMEIAMKISDGLMRDDAVHRIVDVCMKANDIKTAQVLFRAIHASWIRETVQLDYPTLLQ
ncbi:hypothetical protein ABIB73_002269 [Bradyrhizobium sp. F1.4.3]